MIRRRSGSDYLLITQNDHALLTGQLAQSWGNATFASPSPETIQACSLHDCGWPLHDDAPTLNSKGQPLDVFESPVEIALKVWSASAQRAQSAGPYTALLVSLHVLRLSTFPSSHERTRREIFLINQFQQDQIELQESLRRKLNFRTDIPLHFGLATPDSSPVESQVRFDFCLLQAVDRISLAVCCTTPHFPQLKDIHTAPNSSPLSLDLIRLADAVLRVTPWPYKDSELQFQIPFKRIPAGKFESDATFHAVYRSAPTEALAITITSA